MKELVVISGKGGTGKTSIAASFAVLAEHHVIADCDVDAADLHLILEPDMRYQYDFCGGKRACIRADFCTGCGICVDYCRFDAVRKNGRQTYQIDPLFCEGCGVCVRVCPERAVALETAINGRWFVSYTRYGWMVHARLGAGEGNSGKLVALLRQQARKIAKEQGADLVLIDGSPGIGCPVIASITGVDLALVVTEPTLSGVHDFGRIAELTAHFEVPTAVCVNKWDLNPEMTAQIEAQAGTLGLGFVGRVRYDPSVSQAQCMKLDVQVFTS